MNIGQRIRHCLERKELTQKQLAQLSGIPYQSVNKYINNTREPDIATINILADTLDTTVQFLITGQAIAPNELIDECLLMLKDPRLREVYNKLILLTPENLEVAKEHIAVIVKHQDVEKK